MKKMSTRCSHTEDKFSRYTLCGCHGNERECKNHRDWRLCTECVKCDDPTRVADKLWRGLNSYNIYPMLAKDVPRHALCETCSKCQKKIIQYLSWRVVLILEKVYLALDAIHIIKSLHIFLAIINYMNLNVVKIQCYQCLSMYSKLLFLSS